MFKQIVLPFVMGILCLFMLVGCGGSDSQTSGRIDLTVTRTSLAGGLMVVDALAVYTPSTPATLENFPITINFTVRRLDGTVIATLTKDLSANTFGEVNASLEVPQTTDDVVVTVVASSGGLSDRETVAVPSIAAMTPNPTSVAFPVTALAGTTQQVIITGGIGPYSPQISAPADFRVSINGNVITLTKLKTSVPNATTSLTATLTVEDSSNAAPIDITVSYF